MGEPEMKFGSSIAAMIVPWLVGAKYAKEMLLTANDRISAQRAYEVGLVNEVTQGGTHFERALEIATGMANCSPLSMQLTKRAINRGFDISGMRQALLAAIDAATLIESNARPENAEFERLRTTQGMQAALAWRNNQQASAGALNKGRITTLSWPVRPKTFKDTIAECTFYCWKTKKRSLTLLLRVSRRAAFKSTTKPTVFGASIRH
jgi:hypothetical protein